MSSRFPRTWADVREAPWCGFIENGLKKREVLIYVRIDWLPPGFTASHSCSAQGETLWEALRDLRASLWDWIRCPVTGVRYSPRPKDWEAEGFKVPPLRQEVEA